MHEAKQRDTYFSSHSLPWANPRCFYLILSGIRWDPSIPELGERDTVKTSVETQLRPSSALSIPAFLFWYASSKEELPFLSFFLSFFLFFATEVSICLIRQLRNDTFHWCKSWVNITCLFLKITYPRAPSPHIHLESLGYHTENNIMLFCLFMQCCCFSLFHQK